MRCPDFRSCSASWLQALPLPSLQALRNKRRDADKAAKELEVESAALKDFAAEAENAEAEAEDNSQVRCLKQTGDAFPAAVGARLPLCHDRSLQYCCAPHADLKKAFLSHRLPTLQRAHQAFNQQLAQCRRAKEAASAEDSTQRQQLREAEVALEAALKARLSVHPCTAGCPLFGGNTCVTGGWLGVLRIANVRVTFPLLVTALSRALMQAVQDTQRGAQAASRSVTTLQSELRDLTARQGRLTPHADCITC